MHLYETHLHTYPVSKCASADVGEAVSFYRELGYAGIFITNHFLDGNINVDQSLSYEEKINFYFSDYERAKKLGEDSGFDVFFGAELSYRGTDFLVFGLDKEWFLSHPEIMKMSKSEELSFMASEGALIIHAHPFREAAYIDHIRLYPKQVHGVEVINANRTEFENDMAKNYAKSYGLIPFAGTDNHKGGSQTKLAGIKLSSRIGSEREFVQRIKNGDYKIFHKGE